MKQEILPPEDAAKDPEHTLPLYGLDPENLPPALAFTPVPRNGKPVTGLNPTRQRYFIAYLSGCGCVKMAAKAIGVSTSALYQLNKAEGAESFSAAWDTAINMGARRVRDTLMEHAIHGTPERLIKDGEVILERRKFNTRAMQWIVQQRLPEEYGGSLNVTGTPQSALPHSIRKLKEEWRAEWEAEAATNAEDAEAQRDAELDNTLERMTKKYQAKIREEYYHRATGNQIAADFALRQLTQIEVIMDVGGLSYNFINNAFHTAPHNGPWSTKVSRALEDARHDAWEKVSEALSAEPKATAGEPSAKAEDGTETPLPHPIYQRPRIPYYQTEADRAADLAAKAALEAKAVSWREKQAAEQEWRDGRRLESDRPDEGETFLPGS
jgi:hypothetical protein